MKLWPIFAFCLLAQFASFNVLSDTKQNKTPTSFVFSQSMPKDGNLVLGIHANSELGSFGKEIDSRSNGGLTHAINATKFKLSQKLLNSLQPPKIPVLIRFCWSV